MASEIAMKIAKHALVAHAQGRLDDPYQKALNDMAGEADRELQEVREVLTGLRMGGQDCWGAFCSTMHHSTACQRARALSDRLRV